VNLDERLASDMRVLQRNYQSTLSIHLDFVTEAYKYLPPHSDKISRRHRKQVLEDLAQSLKNNKRTADYEGILQERVRDLRNDIQTGDKNFNESMDIILGYVNSEKAPVNHDELRSAQSALEARHSDMSRKITAFRYYLIFLENIYGDMPLDIEDLAIPNSKSISA
jgi:hypothetical protein